MQKKAGGSTSVAIPSLPRKTLLTLHGGVGDAWFMERRRLGLDKFLRDLLCIPAVHDDQHFPGWNVQSVRSNTIVHIRQPAGGNP